MIQVQSPFPIATEVDTPFTMYDLDMALRRLKSNKASGPNEVQGEIYKHAPFVLKLYLLAHYNQCYQEAKVPPSWLFSEVVMIIKSTQKDSRLLSNYRPISLTNISYKIFASMIQHKLERSLDSRLRDRQFGFRKNRSTTQPIHIIRRLLEVFERQNSPFHALFIDWSKAFDSVTFTAIEAAMEHVGVPIHTRKVIMALYDNPTFLIRGSKQKSTVRTQTKGLRQGCPLSPYLFGFVLTHLFHDVEVDYQRRFGEISGVFHVPSPLWDLEYADDTVLLSCSAEQLNRLLHTVQFHGSRRGLVLNEDKCEHLRLHSLHRIFYAPQDATPCQCKHCGGIHPPPHPSTSIRRG